MQAGIRSKDAAVAGNLRAHGVADRVGRNHHHWSLRTGLAADVESTQAYAIVAGTLILSYKGPDLWLKNKITKRSHAIRKGLPDALDLLVICAEAGLTVDAAFGRVSRELSKAYPELG